MQQVERKLLLWIMALVESSQQLGSPQQWTPFSVAFMKIDRFITKEQAQPGSFEDFQDIISQLQRRNFVTNINLVRFFNKSIEELQTKNEQKALRNLATTFFGKSSFYSYTRAIRVIDSLLDGEIPLQQIPQEITWFSSFSNPDMKKDTDIVGIWKMAQSKEDTAPTQHEIAHAVQGKLLFFCKMMFQNGLSLLRRESLEMIRTKVNYSNNKTHFVKEQRGTQEEVT